VAVCRNHQSPLTLYPLVAGTGVPPGSLGPLFPAERGTLPLKTDGGGEEPPLPSGLPQKARQARSVCEGVLRRRGKRKLQQQVKAPAARKGAGKGPDRRKDDQLADDELVSGNAEKREGTEGNVKRDLKYAFVNRGRSYERRPGEFGREEEKNTQGIEPVSVQSKWGTAPK
jgi:hypothetical protein